MSRVHLRDEVERQQALFLALSIFFQQFIKFQARILGKRFGTARTRKGYPLEPLHEEASPAKGSNG
jgi:hypothetical protein